MHHISFFPFYHLEIVKWLWPLYYNQKRLKGYLIILGDAYKGKIPKQNKKKHQLNLNSLKLLFLFSQDLRKSICSVNLNWPSKLLGNSCTCCQRVGTVSFILACCLYKLHWSCSCEGYHIILCFSMDNFEVLYLKDAFWK